MAEGSTHGAKDLQTWTQGVHMRVHIVLQDIQTVLLETVTCTRHQREGRRHSSFCGIKSGRMRVVPG